MKLAKKKLLVGFLLTTLLTLTYWYKPFTTQPTLVIISHATRLADNFPSQQDYKNYHIYHIVQKDCIEAKETKEKLALAKSWVSVEDIYDYQELRKAMYYLNLKKIDHILTFSKECLIEHAAKLRQTFNVKHGMRPNQATPFVNKLVMKQKLAKHNIPQVPFIKDITQAKQTFGFPLVLKPVDKEGSKGIYMIKNDQELKSAMQEIKASKRGDFYIAEKYMKGNDYTISAIVFDGQVKFSIAVESLDKYYDFYRKGSPRRLLVVNAEEKKILDGLVGQIVEHFDLKQGGLFLDCIKDEKTGEILVDEVAYRFGGGGRKEMVKNYYDIDVVREQHKAQLGISPKVPGKEQVKCVPILAFVQFPTPTHWINQSINKEDVFFRIKKISSEEMLQKYGVFVRYFFSREFTTPKKGSLMSASQYITILLQSKDRQLLKNEMEEIKKHFVLTFEPWYVDIKNEVKYEVAA